MENVFSGYIKQLPPNIWYNQDAVDSNLKTRLFVFLGLSAIALIITVSDLVLQLLLSGWGKHEQLWIINYVERGNGKYLVSNIRLVFPILNTFIYPLIIVLFVLHYQIQYGWQLNYIYVIFQDFLPTTLVICAFFWLWSFFQTYMFVESGAVIIGQRITAKVSNVAFITGALISIGSMYTLFGLACFNGVKLSHGFIVLREALFSAEAGWPDSFPSEVPHILDLEERFGEQLRRYGRVSTAMCVGVAIFTWCFTVVGLVMIFRILPAFKLYNQKRTIDFIELLEGTYISQVAPNLAQNSLVIAFRGKKQFSRKDLKRIMLECSKDANIRYQAGLLLNLKTFRLELIGGGIMVTFLTGSCAAIASYTAMVFTRDFVNVKWWNTEAVGLVPYYIYLAVTIPGEIVLLYGTLRQLWERESFKPREGTMTFQEYQHKHLNLQTIIISSKSGDDDREAFHSIRFDNLAPQAEESAIPIQVNRKVDIEFSGLGMETETADDLKS